MLSSTISIQFLEREKKCSKINGQVEYFSVTRRIKINTVSRENQILHTGSLDWSGKGALGPGRIRHPVSLQGPSPTEICGPQTDVFTVQIFSVFQGPVVVPPCVIERARSRSAAAGCAPAPISSPSTSAPLLWLPARRSHRESTSSSCSLLPVGACTRRHFLFCLASRQAGQQLRRPAGALGGLGAVPTYYRLGACARVPLRFHWRIGRHACMQRTHPRTAPETLTSRGPSRRPAGR